MRVILPILMFVHTFQGKASDEEHAIKVLKRHIEDVKEAIPADRLLVYETGSGWEPICSFLSVPGPDEPFPSTNTTSEFRQIRFGEE